MEEAKELNLEGKCTILEENQTNEKNISDESPPSDKFSDRSTPDMPVAVITSPLNQSRKPCKRMRDDSSTPDLDETIIIPSSDSSSSSEKDESLIDLTQI